MFTLPLPRRSLWESFQDLERLFDDMSHTVSTLRHGNETVDHMPINVWSTPDGLMVTAEVPGIAPDRVAVSVLNSTLSIRCSREGANDLTRTVQLPYRVDGDHTEARCQHGLLTVVLRRPEAEKPRRITVKTT